jgi:xanthine phosphoribosyltransferase
MELLKNRILQDAVVRPGNILKVDSFLNHQVDSQFIESLASEFIQHFQDIQFTKVLTIEASGIAIAGITALKLGVPFIFAKKTLSKNLDGSVFSAKVTSYTRNNEYTIMVAKRFITEEDNILIIDDFLASGKALYGLISIVEQSGAKCSGIGVVIEKGFQGGGDELRKKGYPLHSLAIIDEMNDNEIIFRE